MSGKQRAVLATLLLHVNTLVPRQRLVAALWETPPSSAVSNLQTYVAQVRRVLPGSRLLTQGTGYLFEAADGEVDLLGFEEAVRLARAEHHAGNAESAVHHYEKALSRGRPGRCVSSPHACPPGTRSTSWPSADWTSAPRSP